MSTVYTIYEATVNLAGIEAEELETLLMLIPQERQVVGQFLLFKFKEEEGASHQWKDPEPEYEPEHRTRLGDFLSQLDRRNLLSLTYLSSDCSAFGGGGEGEWDDRDFEIMAGAMPTLILQELLAKRLEESV